MEVDSRTQETTAPRGATGYASDSHDSGANSTWRDECKTPASATRSPSWTPAVASAQHPPPQGQSTFRPLRPPGAPATSSNETVVMSSIGFGIDAASTWGDATEACVRALRDAMDRSTLRLPMTGRGLQIHVKLGVPPKHPGQMEPLVVDVTRITSVLPKSIPVLPIHVVVGGLLMSPAENTVAHTCICTAVACITVQSESRQDPASPTAVATPAMGMANPWAHLDKRGNTGTSGGGKTSNTPSPQQHSHPAPARPESRELGVETAEETEMRASTIQQLQLQQKLQQSFQHRHEPHRTEPEQMTAEARHQEQQQRSHELNHRQFHPHSSDATSLQQPQLSHQQHLSEHVQMSPRISPPQKPPKNSIEMLAMISEEIRERQQMNLGGSPKLNHNLLSSKSSGGTDTLDCQEESDQQMLEKRMGNLQDRTAGYSYKKLPPGVTTKNNKRLFVKHIYRDYSRERPLPEEEESAATIHNGGRTPNAAFPLKLHETLSQIEQNGHGDIIGWLPHGRSFKIHKQKEFAEVILPRYFIMTKKSSFLRQLNLYGFNRFSAGPDRGSYYHEKFLRGLKFLAKRMTRQKINGNGIRAAGNPDNEPNLNKYPVCPPGSSVTLGSMDGLAARQGDEDDTQNQLLLYRNISFPLKLQRILDKLESEGNDGILSWLSHGRAFCVNSTERFVNEIMPIYFNQTKYSSFQRQLHMYNFQRITAGPDKGAYHHPSFQRGRPQLCLKMVRTRVKGSGYRKPGDPTTEPNLYKMDPMPPIDPGTSIEIPLDLHGSDYGDDSESED